MSDKLKGPQSATDEIRERVLVLRSKAERARDEARRLRETADESDGFADQWDAFADQYVALIGSTTERPLFGDVHIVASNPADMVTGIQRAARLKHLGGVGGPDDPKRRR